MPNPRESASPSGAEGSAETKEQKIERIKARLEHIQRSVAGFMEITKKTSPQGRNNGEEISKYLNDALYKYTEEEVNLKDELSTLEKQ